MTTLHLERTSHVTVLGGAAVVFADGNDLHEQLWPSDVPILVVLPPYAEPDVVVRAFALGADACIRTASDAEISAHLGAMLRRRVA